MKKEDLFIIFLLCFLCMVLGGAIVNKSYSSSPQQVIIDKQYEQCIHSLPRNKDCKFVSANFEIVDIKDWCYE